MYRVPLDFRPVLSSMSNLHQTFLDISSLPNFAIFHKWITVLKQSFPDRHLFVSEQYDFDWHSYCEANQIEVTRLNDFDSIESWRFEQSSDEDEEDKLSRYSKVGFYSLPFRDQNFWIFSLILPADFRPERYNIVLSPNPASAEEFYIEICKFTFPLQGDILEFSDGCWSRSRELKKSIEGVNFSSLVLESSVRERLVEDTKRFLNSKELYKKFGIPWKRGIILIGPPGNGKTMTIKAMVNEFKLPALYVRSFEAEHMTNLSLMSTVFEEARRRAPCFLIFEDLDALLTPESRSFFLNEMDGFASNHGIFTIATTNYPERIEAGLINRPSRFDTSYVVDLPEKEQRLDYLKLLMKDLDAVISPSNSEFEAIADTTEGFSMAYLKELFVVSLMAWIEKHNEGTSQSFADTMKSTTSVLKAELAKSLEAPESVEEKPKARRRRRVPFPSELE